MKVLFLNDELEASYINLYVHISNSILRIKTCDERPDHLNVHISENSHAFSTNNTSIESLISYLPNDTSITRTCVSEF